MNKISIAEEMRHQILILDGAMGTMLQAAGFSDPDFKLILSHPEAIANIHRQYIAAGAHIIETCTFNANAISLAEYGMADRVEEINRKAAETARKEVQSARRSDLWIAGSIGPTSKSLTLALNLGDTITFDEMEAAYYTQIKTLIESDVDLLLIETIFDTLNAKAAIHAALRAMETTGIEIPIMLSVTLTESGRTLTGQLPEAFAASVAHARPLAIMFNCGFGPDKLLPHLDSIQSIPAAVGIYPNAGLPDKMGRYNLSPTDMRRAIEPAMADGKLNIVGGCCGTTPQHISQLAILATSCPRRQIPEPDGVTRLAGLELLEVRPENNFLAIGERCNVAGSRKFLRLINENSIDEAVDIAIRQVESGAGALDINMDDGLLDGPGCMSRFVARLQVEPTAAKVPMVIDSSNWETILAGLKRVQGRPLVNSISLKEGPEKMIERAREIKRLGGAMVVMAFDEKGQATTLERKIEIVTRAYRLLTEQAGIEGNEIFFDCNILTIATGLPEHDSYATDFIEAVRYIKAHLPGAKTGGGVSNLSFAFRGNNYVREAMHAIFLHHAIEAGLDSAIVNAASLTPVDLIPDDLRRAVDDVIFHRDPGATERLTAIAASSKPSLTATDTPPQMHLTPEQSLEQLILKGSSAGLEQLMDELAVRYARTADIIDGPLMGAMNRVGEMFGDGRMFLPQVVRSAAVMKEAVRILEPRLEADNATGATAGRSHRVFILATVKGDVHDIGKNIVGILLRCNGWEVIDLGIMVPPEAIIEAAVTHGAAAIGVSGLITPSLEEMCRLAAMMQDRGLDIPLFVGGATTSALHTALRIAPLYPRGVVVHTRDGAVVPGIAARLLSPGTGIAERTAIKIGQQRLAHCGSHSPDLLSLSDARDKAFSPSSPSLPVTPGLRDFNFSIDRLKPIFNYKALLAAWKLDPAQPGTQAALDLRANADALMERLQADGYTVNARAVTVKARKNGDDIVTPDLVIPTLRRQSPGHDGTTLSTADFICQDTDDTITLFAVTAPDINPAPPCSTDDFDFLLAMSVAHRLAEAATELLHRELSGGNERIGIRPAIGYPMMPDQSIVHLLDKILKYADLGITTTENGALHPSATTTGLIILNPEARYFDIGQIDATQLADYSRRRGLPIETIQRFLAKVTSDI